MKAKEFINKDIKTGTKVTVTMCTGTTFNAFFGGYKTFNMVNTNLDWGLYPVFYKISKNGKMLRQSVFGRNRATYVGLHEIAGIEKMTGKPYRVVARLEDNNYAKLRSRGVAVTLNTYLFKTIPFVDAAKDEPVQFIQEDDDTVIVKEGEYAVRFCHSGIIHRIEILKRQER